MSCTALDIYLYGASGFALAMVFANVLWAVQERARRKQKEPQ